jgi:hypothetical protein
MHASEIVAYLNSNKFPSAILADARREVRGRLMERWQAGRAESELTFNDIFEKLEATLLK